MTRKNEEMSTKVSSIFSEIDRVVYRNDSLRTEVQTLEEQLDDKKRQVTENKSKLKDLNST